jgi:hypothetical protein
MPARWPSTWWTTPACQRASPPALGITAAWPGSLGAGARRTFGSGKQNAAHRSALEAPGPGAWQLSADTKLCRAQYTHNWPICAPSCLAWELMRRVQTRRYAWFELLSIGLFVTVRYSRHGTGSGWTAGGLISSRGSSPVTPRAGPPGPETGAAAMVERACWEQHKSNTSPAIYEDQHAGNTDKTAFTGTRRHDR